MDLPNPIKLVPNPKNFAREFRDFLLKSNLISLALAFVIGAGVNKVVNSIVADLIMPVVGRLSPSGDWRTMVVGFAGIKWTLGAFLGTVVDFLIIATLVFVLTKFLVKQSVPPPTRTCPLCKEGNHPEATRCKWCTSEITAGPATPPAA